MRTSPLPQPRSGSMPVYFPLILKLEPNTEAPSKSTTSHPISSSYSKDDHTFPDTFRSEHKAYYSSFLGVNRSANIPNCGPKCYYYRRNRMAQNSEDVWLYEHWFAGVKNGVVMESGALEGLQLSTTYMFEVFSNWSSIHIGIYPHISLSFSLSFSLSLYIYIYIYTLQDVLVCARARACIYVHLCLC